MTMPSAVELGSPAMRPGYATAARFKGRLLHPSRSRRDARRSEIQHQAGFERMRQCFMIRIRPDLVRQKAAVFRPKVETVSLFAIFGRSVWSEAEHFAVDDAERQVRR